CLAARVGAPSCVGTLRLKRAAALGAGAVSNWSSHRAAPPGCNGLVVSRTVPRARPGPVARVALPDAAAGGYGDGSRREDTHSVARTASAGQRCSHDYRSRTVG